LGRSALLLLALLLTATPGRSEEIQLETCDRLPVIQVRVSGTKFLFLVDTAATSMLNLKSFSHGDRRVVRVMSWSGTVETSGQEVILADFAVGQHHFKNLKLRAVDLSAIGRACGRVISGILGIDLLGRLNARLDLKDNAARLVMDSDNAQARIAEVHAQLVACEQAFNRADEDVFADCLDPQVVIFAAGGDFYGREAAMQYYRKRYFQADPRAQLSITPRAHHALGEAIWVEYDLRVTQGQQVILARGTALCQKESGKWRIVHMNHSNPPSQTQAAGSLR